MTNQNLLDAETVPEGMTVEQFLRERQKELQSTKSRARSHRNFLDYNSGVYKIRTPRPEA